MASCDYVVGYIYLPTVSATQHDKMPARVKKCNKPGSTLPANLHVNESMTPGAFDLANGDMVRGGGSLLDIAAQWRERAGSQCPAVVSEELAVGDLIGADLITVAIQDIEQHDGTITIRQGHSAARYRDIGFAVVMSELESVADDLEITGRRGIAVGECRTQK